MSDAAKATLNLTTIAICLVFICGLVFWGTQSYDRINSTLSKLSDGQVTLLQGQQNEHAWLVSLDSKVSEHEKQLDRIQASADAAKHAAETTSARDKRYEDRND